jgi:hypothetical protein
MAGEVPGNSFPAGRRGRFPAIFQQGQEFPLGQRFPTPGYDWGFAGEPLPPYSRKAGFARRQAIV